MESAAEHDNKEFYTAAESGSRDTVKDCLAGAADALKKGSFYDARRFCDIVISTDPENREAQLLKGKAILGARMESFMQKPFRTEITALKDDVKSILKSSAEFMKKTGKPLDMAKETGRCIKDWVCIYSNDILRSYDSGLTTSQVFANSIDGCLAALDLAAHVLGPDTGDTERLSFLSDIYGTKAALGEALLNSAVSITEESAAPLSVDVWKTESQKYKNREKEIKRKALTAELSDIDFQINSINTSEKDLISELEKELLPETTRFAQIEERIQRLSFEKRKAGLMSVKDRKDIREQIEQEKIQKEQVLERISSISRKIDKMIAETEALNKEKITALKTRAKAISAELSKERDGNGNDQ